MRWGTMDFDFDFENQWERFQTAVLDAYDQAVIYFDSLGTYGLVGWALVVVGLILLITGAILLAV